MSKKLIKKSDEQNARELSKELLGSIMNYQTVFDNIKRFAIDESLDPVVRLKALDMYKQEFQFLRGHEIKVPKEESEDLSGLDDSELDALISKIDIEDGKVIEIDPIDPLIQ